MYFTEKEKKVFLGLVEKKIDDILSGFDDLSHILSSSVSISSYEYFKCCDFLFHLQKKILELHSGMSNIPVVRSYSEGK